MEVLDSCNDGLSATLEALHSAGWPKLRVCTGVKPVSGGDFGISATDGSTGGRGSKHMPVNADEQERTSSQNTNTTQLAICIHCYKARDPAAGQVLQFSYLCELHFILTAFFNFDVLPFIVPSSSASWTNPSTFLKAVSSCLIASASSKS